MDKKLVNLAVVGPYRNLFTYQIRPEDEENLRKGCRFLVPFGSSLKIGFFVDYQAEPVAHRLRPAKERLDIFSPFPDYLFEFCRWVAGYYFAGLGETLAAALPGEKNRKPKLEFAAVDLSFLGRDDFPDKVASDLAVRFVKRKTISAETLVRDEALMPIIRHWIEMGVVTARYRMGKRKEVVDQSDISYLSSYPIRRDLPGLKLLADQAKVVEVVSLAIDEKRFEPFLLFGITGSGKTLVYCHAAKQAVADGGSVLVMVPEIALSGLLLSSFAAFFGDQVAVIHSGLTGNQRQMVRQRIASGEVKVVIGPRSAIFSPMKNLRLIIVDEEHDPSYKQDDPSPRYHARDAAVMLARLVSCPVILGSASPSIESYHNAATGRYHLLILDKRPVSGYKMPQIVTLDMVSEKISGDCSFLSFQLKKETEKHIAAGGQVIYYLNRRGFAPRLKCGECGEVPVCPDCGVTLTYHKSSGQLKCHFCDRVEPAPRQCPRCHSADFIYIGTGTQRVEENLTRLFAGIKAQRIDSDQTARKSGQLILSDFAEDKFDLLVGTQMVTKGLDIPNVTLVGVLSADIGLDMPDFRAAEKTYARLLQVAGRTGRGDREGTVMIQTFYHDHFVIRHLAEGDYVHFYEKIIADRQELLYPPFVRLINITLVSRDDKALEKEAIGFRDKLERRLSGLAGVRLLGPAPAPLYKLRGNYRRRLIIKFPQVKKVVTRLRDWESREKSFGLSPKTKAVFDIDPVNMM